MNHAWLSVEISVKQKKKMLKRLTWQQEYMKLSHGKT